MWERANRPGAAVRVAVFCVDTKYIPTPVPIIIEICGKLPYAVGFDESRSEPFSMAIQSRQFTISELLVLTSVLAVEIGSMVRRNVFLFSIFLIVALIAGAVSRRREFALILLALTSIVFVAGSVITWVYSIQMENIHAR